MARFSTRLGIVTLALGLSGCVSEHIPKGQYFTGPHTSGRGETELLVYLQHPRDEYGSFPTDNQTMIVFQPVKKGQ